jgi:hypothetical protein
MTIGRLERVPLREVWKHEALDFTTWLRDNVEVLNDELDITIANVEREQAAGSFSVDLVGEDEDGHPVVIENQLEKSDHDHLGKLITYLTAFEAKTAIWIVPFPRPEHIAAVARLNQSTPASFYMFKVEAVRIGDSPPALLLTKLVGPSEEGREVGDTKKEIAERNIIRQKFWRSLLERARPRTPLHANISPSQYHWIGATSGQPGLNLNYGIRQHDGQVEIYIDRRDETDNQMLFDRLYQQRLQIEEAFGEPLDWHRLDGKRACRIQKHVDVGGYRDDEDRWPEIQDALIEAMIRLERVFRPYIDQLPR